MVWLDGLFGCLVDEVLARDDYSHILNPRKVRRVTGWLLKRQLRSPCAGSAIVVDDVGRVSLFFLFAVWWCAWELSGLS
jgi:hypothetical protein